VTGTFNTQLRLRKLNTDLPGQRSQDLAEMSPILAEMVSDRMVFI
jgi:hypothetical protein